MTADRKLSAALRSVSVIRLQIIRFVPYSRARSVRQAASTAKKWTRNNSRDYPASSWVRREAASIFYRLFITEVIYERIALYS